MNKPLPLFSRTLREWRGVMGFTQREAALRLGVRCRTLEGWERGRKPTPALATHLGARLQAGKKTKKRRDTATQEA